MTMVTSRLNRSKKAILLLKTVILASSPPESNAAAATATHTALCSSCMSLMDLASHLKSRMPDRESELYIVPSQKVMEDWEGVVRGMMMGSCDDMSLPLSLGGYGVQTFVDRTDSRTYCVLAAVGDGSTSSVVPWGTVIINKDRNARPLSIDVPHPLHDANTVHEGIAVFKGTGARSYVLSGSHRYANAEPSPCQSTFGIADAAHNKVNTFLSGISAILSHYDELDIEHTAIQLHGMGSSTCPGVDIHLSHGSNVAPAVTDKIVRLRDALAAIIPQGSTVTVPGDEPPCNMGATLNIQGRLLNGVAVEDLCEMYASGYSNRFIHVEQKYAVRKETRFHQFMIDAINDALFQDSLVGTEAPSVLTHHNMKGRTEKTILVAMFICVIGMVFLFKVERRRGKELGEVELPPQINDGHSSNGRSSGGGSPNISETSSLMT